MSSFAIYEPKRCRIKEHRKLNGYTIYRKSIGPAIRLLVWTVGIAFAVASELGSVPPGGFQSPEADPRFAPEAGVKPLNNLVFELVNQESPGTEPHTFRNPRDGWIYIRVLPTGDNAPTSILLDDTTVALKKFGGHLEAMRYVSAGAHTVALNDQHEPAKRLEVRAIGELVYATYGDNPHIAETGVYTWEYLREHCLDHYNSIIGTTTRTEDGKSAQEAEIREWTAEGKRWFVREDVPYDVSTVDEAYDRWSNSLGMQHPLMSGIWADEFGVGEKYGKQTAEMYPIWIGAIKKLRADPAFSNRIFYAYGPSRLLPAERFEQMYPFIQTIVECGYRLGPEWYLPESQSRPGRVIVETGDLLAEFSPAWEMASRESFERASKGAATERLVVVSLLSEPGWETGDLFPNYDFNVFLDCEMQFISTDSAFFGVRGLHGYVSGYCAEEQTRLFAKLVRHYAIEGNTHRFLADPYVLRHIQNADLANGTDGWTLSPAIDTLGQESIAVKTVPGFGTLQAKYHGPEGAGDVALWTRRCGDKPNVISQQIQNLTPGRLYSLRFITGDFQGLGNGASNRRQHAVSATIQNADRMMEKCFQAIVQCGYWQPYGEFNSSNPYWINYHQYVFRAHAINAELRLSDWPSDNPPGADIGQELIWNFIQVQPYFE
ncbi:MAG: hypothetical protein HUU46_18920 [Candidatus Hydrogenedentes bacterium]|nr:hypothetical protein [Candidatus Hydrogenedentota bacterium]